MRNIRWRTCDEIIDGEGKYLSPGFIDIHNHGNFGHIQWENLWSIRCYGRFSH